MTELQHRGRCRLMLRIPAWRAEFREAMDPDFLELCEAYELAWDACSNRTAARYADEFHQLADWLETEALSLVLLKQRRIAV